MIRKTRLKEITTMTNTSPRPAAGTGRCEQLMASSRRMLVAAFLMTSTLIHPSTLTAQETITPLISNDLADVPGKESLMYTVEFPPGFSSPVHRHNAHVSLYVLEGSVVMQVKGGKEITLTPGQSFSEGPGDGTSLAATQAVQGRPDSSCSWSRTRALRC